MFSGRVRRPIIFIEAEGGSFIVKIAVLGGTGSEGRGLGLRWAMAGHEVLIGSRSAERGARAAEEMNELLGDSRPEVKGADNASTAGEAEVVVLSVPYEAQRAILEDVKEAVRGKVLVTVVAPLKSPKSHVWHPPAGSAAEEAQAFLGEETRVVAAFQNISAELLPDPAATIDCDVLICGDDKEDKALARGLAQAAGLRGIDAGPLQNAGLVEGLTAVLIGINIRNKVKHSGVRITGLPQEAV